MVAPQKTNTTRTTRQPKAKLAPIVHRLTEQGFTAEQIAEKIGRSVRTVYELRAFGKLSGDALIIEAPDFKLYSALSQAAKDKIAFSVEAFESFFNAYSGKILAPVHKDWVSDAIEEDRLLLNCPPRHAKSTIFSVWFPIWLISGAHACLVNPDDPDKIGLRNVQILLVSQTDKLAKKFTNEISFHLTSNQKLIKDFGRFKPEMGDWPWRPNSGELMVDMRSRETESGDLTIQVRGAGQQILGMEADWVIVDDAVSRENATHEVQREQLSEWFHGDVMSRLEPKDNVDVDETILGRAIVIGQRVHLHDLYGELAKEAHWHHINKPAVLDWSEQKVLWPERRPFNILMKTRQDVGEDMFEAMYQQNPLSSNRRLATKEWLYGDDEHLGCVDPLRIAGIGIKQPEDRNVVRVVSLDPSPTRYAGLIVADVPYDERMFTCHIIEIVRDKMSVRDMLYHLDRVVDMYAPDYFIFEQAAAQRWFLQDKGVDRLKQRMTILPHNTGRNKGDPTLGVESLAVEFEFGRIRCPTGDAESRAMSELLFDEARTYPQGLTDDLLMALWFIKFNYIRLLPRNMSGGSTGGRSIPPRLQHGWDWWNRATAARKAN